MYNYKGYQIPEYKDPNWNVPIEVFMEDSIDYMTNQIGLFEYVSKNLKSYNHTVNYVNDAIDHITYQTGTTGSIIKTFTYDSNGNIITITLSGNLPPYMTKTRKNIEYTNNNISSVTYS